MWHCTLYGNEKCPSNSVFADRASIRAILSALYSFGAVSACARVVIGKRTANTRARVVHVIFVILFFIGISIRRFGRGSISRGLSRRSRCRDLSLPRAVSLLAGNTTPDRENYQRTEVSV